VEGQAGLVAGAGVPGADGLGGVPDLAGDDGGWAGSGTRSLATR